MANEDLRALFKILSHKKRYQSKGQSKGVLEILKKLYEKRKSHKKGLTIERLVKVVDSPPTLNRYIRELKDIGIIEAKKVKGKTKKRTKYKLTKKGKKIVRKLNEIDTILTQ